MEYVLTQHQLLQLKHALSLSKSHISFNQATSSAQALQVIHALNEANTVLTELEAENTAQLQYSDRTIEPHLRELLKQQAA